MSSVAVVAYMVIMGGLLLMCQPDSMIFVGLTGIMVMLNFINLNLEKKQ